MESQALSPPTIGAILTFGLIALMVFWIGWRRKFFLFSQSSWEFPLRFSHLIVAFAIYFFASFFSSLIFMTLLKSKTTSSYIDLASWFNFSTSGIILASLLAYWRLLPEKIRLAIWLRPSEKEHLFSEDLCTAFLAWFISFPFVLFLSNLLEYLIFAISRQSQLPDQLAVQFLKMTFAHPLHLLLAALSIIFFAPLIEELLFRGFLQSFIRQHLGSKQAVLITSACFALFHYSKDQGLGNIPVICSLFILSLFLGFLYEKRGSLLAPITLHASFNAISVINLYFLGGIHGGI